MDSLCMEYKIFIMTAPESLNMEALQTMMRAWVHEISTKQTEILNKQTEYLNEKINKQTENLTENLNELRPVSYTHLS